MATSATHEAVTWCRVCEACCGLVATVDNGRVVNLRPDPDHPISRGYACPKGLAMVDIQNDADRVLHPLKRRADGTGFDRVSWDDAIADIGRRLRAVKAEHGADAIAWYAGVSYGFSFGHYNWSKSFMRAIGSPHYYSSISQDVGARFVASHFLYGSTTAVPIPDLERTDFLLVVGGNPLISNGSALTAPRIRERLAAIRARGGRVVAVDPRRTETARAFEHVAILPDTDAWFLLSMLHVVFAEGLEDKEFLDKHTTGADWVRGVAADFPPERTEALTGVPAAVAAGLARAFATAPSAAGYSRTGLCRGRFGTLATFLLDALNAATGNIDRAGGMIFTDPAIPVDRVGRMVGFDTYGKLRTRIGGYPDVMEELPAGVLADEITTPGPGQIRALIVTAGNPVLTVPGSNRLEAALNQLDLLVSTDLYVNETNKHADYVLPAATWLERSEAHNWHTASFVTPYIQFSPRVVPPAGEAKEDWEIIDALARQMRVVPAPTAGLRLLARLGIRPGPRMMHDSLLRTGPHGDWYGLRRKGLSFTKLAARPHGVQLAERHPTGVLRKKVRHRGGRIHLHAPEIEHEVTRLAAAERERATEFPLLLTSLRELRSHNSWTHNARRLMRNRRFALRVHPGDAARSGVADGDSAILRSKYGQITVPVAVTDEMMPGAVTLPWGWGHAGGWQIANAAGGANVNELHPSGPDHLERLAGMAWLNGLPVAIEPVPGRYRSLRKPVAKERK